MRAILTILLFSSLAFADAWGPGQQAGDLFTPSPSGGGGGGGMAIGGTVTSGTSKSPLFVDGNGSLAQDNANYSYDPTTHSLSLTKKLLIGTNTHLSNNDDGYVVAGSESNIMGYLGSLPIDGGNVGFTDVNQSDYLYGVGDFLWRYSPANPRSLSFSVMGNHTRLITFINPSNNGGNFQAHLFWNTDGAGVIGSPDGGTTMNRPDLVYVKTRVESGGLLLNGATASTISYFDSGKNLVSSSVTPTQLTGLQVEQLDGQIASPGNATYHVRLKCQYATTINSIYIGTDSGSDTVAVKINGTSVTGLSAISVTSTPASTNASGGNVCSVGQPIDIVTSSDSSATNLSWSIKATRN